MAFENIILMTGISIWLMLLMIVLVLWTAFWKIFGLWTAARKKHIGWFILLFFIQTAGILEILYIYVFSKWGKKK